MDPIGDVERDVALVQPSGWEKDDIARPDVGSIRVDAWRAWHAPEHGDQHLIAGCMGTELDTWTPEAAPIAFERIAATARSTLTRLDLPAALHVAREIDGPRVSEESLVGDGEVHAGARTFLGFTAPEGASRLMGCFVLCAPATPPCTLAMDSATPTSAFVPPPATSLPLRVVVLGVHHSDVAALGAATLFVLAGGLAIWTRPRPRRK